MAIIRDNGQPIADAVAVLYISNEGKIVASARVVAEVDLQENQLDTEPPASDATSYISCEISAESVSVVNGKRLSLNFEVRRICYDRLGRRIPCP